MLYAYGPQVLIHREIEGLKNVKQAFIFGSWVDEVNVQVMGEQDWNNGEGSFLKTVKSRPLVVVEREALGPK